MKTMLKVAVGFVAAVICVCVLMVSFVAIFISGQATVSMWPNPQALLILLLSLAVAFGVSGSVCYAAKVIISKI